MRRKIFDSIVEYIRLQRSLSGLSKHSSFTFSKVRNYIYAYLHAYVAFAHISHELFNSIKLDDKDSFKSMILMYLIERISIAPQNIATLVEANPLHSHADTAAINRGFLKQR